MMEGERENSSLTTPGVNLWPMGFCTAALAKVSLPQCGWCAYIQQFVLVSKLVSVAAVHCSCTEVLYSDPPGSGACTEAHLHLLKHQKLNWG